jgi:multiple sugar transport system permease protein
MLQRSSLGRSWRKALLYAGLFAAFVWAVFPFYWMVVTSLRPESQLFARPPSLVPDEITLRHYVGLLVGGSFWRHALNSLVLTVCFRGSTLLPALMLYGQMFPAVLLLIPFFVQFRALGWIDSLWALVLVYLSYMLPLCVWLMRGFFAQVPFALEDAARMDGCTRWQAFWRVIVPMARPGIIAVATWSMIHAWNEFLFASVLISSAEKRTLPLGLSALIGQYTTDWGVLMAGGVLTALPIVAIFFALQRHLVSGLGGGAVKG